MVAELSFRLKPPTARAGLPTQDLLFTHLTLMMASGRRHVILNSMLTLSMATSSIGLRTNQASTSSVATNYALPTSCQLLLIKASCGDSLF